MKYLVIESAVADGARANAVTVKDTYNDARMLFHQIRASQLANESVTYGMAMIVGDDTRVFDKEYHGEVTA